jgi:hypothetical protein
LIDVRTGHVTPLTWVNRKTETLKIPLQDSVEAVTDVAYLDWPEAPEAPGELAAMLSGRDVQLKWRKYGSSSGFEVQRSVDWGTWNKVAELPADQVAYTEHLPQGAHITYRIRALGGRDRSAWSNPAWVDAAQ